jgi:hypothetical protein
MPPRSSPHAVAQGLAVLAIESLGHAPGGADRRAPGRHPSRLRGRWPSSRTASRPSARSSGGRARRQPDARPAPPAPLPRTLCPCRDDGCGRPRRAHGSA